MSLYSRRSMFGKSIVTSFRRRYDNDVWWLHPFFTIQLDLVFVPEVFITMSHDPDQAHLELLPGRSRISSHGQIPQIVLQPSITTSRQSDPPRTRSGFRPPSPKAKIIISKTSLGPSPFSISLFFACMRACMHSRYHHQRLISVLIHIPHALAPSIFTSSISEDFSLLPSFRHFLFFFFKGGIYLI